MPKISCPQHKLTTSINKGENILDVFEKIKIELPQGCRSGTCGVCVIELLNGEKQLVAANQVELNTLERLYAEKLRLGAKLRLGCRTLLEKDLGQEISFNIFSEPKKIK